MSTLTFSPWLMNSGTWISWPVSSGGRLGAAGGAVAGEAGLGEGDHELDRGGQLDEEHAALVGGHDGLLVLQEEVGGVADDLGVISSCS